MIKTHFELHLGLYNFDVDSFYRYLALMYDFFLTGREGAVPCIGFCLGGP